MRALVTFISFQELRKTESTLRAERDQWRDQATGNKHEVEKLRGTNFFFSGTEAKSRLSKRLRMMISLVAHKI